MKKEFERTQKETQREGPSVTELESKLSAGRAHQFQRARAIPARARRSVLWRAGSWVEVTDDLSDKELFMRILEAVRIGGRKNMGLIVRGGFARLAIPVTESPDSVTTYLAEHIAWVRKTAAKQKKNAEQRKACGCDPRIGGHVYFQGERYAVLEGDQTGRYVLDEKARTLAIAPCTGVGGLEADEEVKARIAFWLIEKFKDLVYEMQQDLQCEMGIRALGMASVSSASSRWGSCSTDGRIRLNWRLVCLPSRLMNYVFVHELAHRRHFNHSPQFWDLVRRFDLDADINRREIGRWSPDWVFPGRAPAASIMQKLQKESGLSDRRFDLSVFKPVEEQGLGEGREQWRKTRDDLAEMLGFLMGWFDEQEKMR